MAVTQPTRVLALGIGAFTQGCLRILREDGAEVQGYLTRDYGHYGPRLEAACRSATELPDPVDWMREQRPDVIVPMSIEWALRPWTDAFLASGLPLLCPTG
ncbi:MAG: hypothetical protein RLZ45_1136, partial [Verrucomicrobiota bacterium]